MKNSEKTPHPEQVKLAVMNAAVEAFSKLAHQPDQEPKTKAKATRREQGMMITVRVKITPAVIQFEDIAQAVTFERDDEQPNPRDFSDGYDHENQEAPDFPDIDDARGYYYGDRHSQHSGNRLVTIENFNEWGIYQHRHKQGAAKQVARQIEAAEVARTIEHIVDWYEDRFYYLCAFVEFKGKTASLSGIDAHEGDSYTDEVRRELAQEIAHELTAEGYTIEGTPGITQEEKRQKTRAAIAEKINSQNAPDILAVDRWQAERRKRRQDAERARRKVSGRQRRKAYKESSQF